MDVSQNWQNMMVNRQTEIFTHFSVDLLRKMNIFIINKQGDAQNLLGKMTLYFSLGEPLSNFEVKSKFSKQWWNEKASHLQNLNWNQIFVTVAKCDSELPSKIKTIMNMSQISKQWRILHLHHQRNCEILCEFFALGLHTLNSSQHIASTYKIKVGIADTS